MSRYERLHTLIIRGCNELREIRRLPHSIRRVEVDSCHSLDLQSFFQLVPEIIGLPPNLPPCLGVTSHMLMFPHSSTISGRQTCRCEYSFKATADENDIPNWFNHQRDGNLISFSIGPEFPTIALCVAFEFRKQDYGDFDYYVFVSINGSERMFERKIIEIDRSLGHLCFSCRPQSSLQELFRDLQLTDRNHVEILCVTYPRRPCRPQPIFRYIAAPIVQRIGVHAECNCPPPQNPSIINRHLSLQSGSGLPMDTENGSDSESGLKSLDEFLTKVYAAVLVKPGYSLLNVCKWYDAVSSQLAASFPGKAVGVRVGGKDAPVVAAPAKEVCCAHSQDCKIWIILQSYVRYLGVLSYNM
ncbi:hypothetical protein SO802_008123 [Lithocarpus litseifolius]|uniref:Uncharacterized protein n=1 Tax=Lithocarpus litseifolius TaxID=425828 RepID=A0AAW2DD73_9ROSI